MDAEKYKEASFKIIVRDDPENTGAHASTKGSFLKTTFLSYSIVCIMQNCPNHSCF